MNRIIRNYLILTAIVLLTNSSLGCNGSGEENWDFIDRFIENIPGYKATSPWEVWYMTSTLIGDDDKDYSFHTRLVVTRDGDNYSGFGNANGYNLGTYLITGVRSGDSIEFEIHSQNRYRAYSLTGQGIYLKASTEIGGNNIEGKDFLTVYDDPVSYTGNFQVDVLQINSPTISGIYEGYLDGAYDSIENGEIVLKTNEEGTSLTIEDFSGTLVGENQTEGSFSFNDSSVFGEIEIDSMRFSSIGTDENDVIEINGCITQDVASGMVIYQREGNVYIGAFSALLK